MFSTVNRPFTMLLTFLSIRKSQKHLASDYTWKIEVPFGISPNSYSDLWINTCIKLMVGPSFFKVSTSNRSPGVKLVRFLPRCWHGSIKWLVHICCHIFNRASANLHQLWIIRKFNKKIAREYHHHFSQLHPPLMSICPRESLCTNISPPKFTSSSIAAVQKHCKMIVLGHKFCVTTLVFPLDTFMLPVKNFVSKPVWCHAQLGSVTRSLNW